MNAVQKILRNETVELWKWGNLLAATDKSGKGVQNILDILAEERTRLSESNSLDDKKDAEDLQYAVEAFEAIKNKGTISLLSKYKTFDTIIFHEIIIYDCD